MKSLLILLTIASAMTAGQNDPVSAALHARIQAVLQHSPALSRGRIGYQFVDIESGALLAAEGADRFFTPASNAKLYSTALALARLGPGYRLRTQLRTSGTWNGQDTLPDLQLVGGGDPNLSGRTMPYLVGAPEGDPLAAIRQLADMLVDKGIRCIGGDVIGVASRYQTGSYPDGWTLDDSLYSYGAPVSALSVNDSAVALILRPSTPGELAEVELRPSFAHFIVLNKVLTDASGQAHIQLSRPPGTNELIVTGSLGRTIDQWRQDVAVEDPALFAAEALLQVLRERGIQVGGQARAQYEPADSAPPTTLLAEKLSQPLSQILQVINKESQNLHAESVLREVAFFRTGVGSLENGRKEQEAFLAEAGVTHEGTGYVLDDGSGLARQDLATPASTVTLLRSMWQRSDRDVWIDTLPIAALDGSLQHRFRTIAGAARLRAKTGSLSHVNTLSGYIETLAHHTIAFSVMVNGTPGHESEVRDAIDRLCAVFLTL